jgi:integrase
MGRDGSGVEIREASIRVTFTWRNKRCRETLDLAPTPANVKYATRLVEEIRRKISIGSFDYASYFPNSKHAKDSVTAGATFKAMCDMWLKTKGRLAAATLSQYKNALLFWQGKLGSDKPVDSLSHGKIAAVVGAHPWPSAKLCNNYLIPLRGVFALAGREIKNLDNPLEGIENAKHQKPPPDPLSTKEMETILADLHENYHPQVFNYFEFSFMTGMRPEEVIALRWSDVDWNHGTIKVERAKSFRGQIKPLKTYAVRDVDLVDRAIKVLHSQKQYTFMKSTDVEIFENPVTGRPWHDERSQRDHYWQPSLKRIGIRMRRPYQTRHTYATNALMAGVNPAYVSRQMGHRSAKMLFSVYAKWIDNADNGREKAKMEALLKSNNAPRMPQLPDFTGRHDWTRTNPPIEIKPHKKKRS